MTYQTHKKILFPVIIFFSLVLFFFTSAHVEASSTYGRAGWLNITHSIDGDDDSCGSDEVSVTLEVRDGVTDESLNVPSAIIGTINQTGQLVNMNTSENSNGVGPVCWNPDTDSVAYDVDGGTQYYNLSSTYITNDPDALPRQKAVTGIVWLTPITEGYDYDKVYPSPTSLTIASSSPEYTYTLNRIPSIYGADALSYVNFFLYEFDPYQMQYTRGILSRVINQDGGVGTKTLPVQDLEDGWYGWSLYLHLNTDIDSGYGVETLNVPKSGFTQLPSPFILDTTPPNLVLDHNPGTPVAESEWRIQVSATDDLSGVTEIDIYVNDTLERSCSYASVYSATCEFTFDSLPAGEYEYYAVAKDRAGNTSISEVGFFEATVEPITVAVEPLECEVPNTEVLDTSTAYSGSGYAGLQAMKKVGNYLYTGGAGSASADAKGLFIYDISDPENIMQMSFFSTTRPSEVVINSGSSDVIGLDVVGDYAYLATYYGGMVIVNVSDVSNPVFVSKIQLNNVNTGSRETWEVEVRGNYAYLAAGKGLLIVDVTDKTNPVLVSNLDLDAGISQDIALAGNYAYIAMRSQGVRVVDIADPREPRLVGSITAGYYSSFLSSWAYSVAVTDNILYIADHYTGRISVVNVSNPANPIRIRTIPVGSFINFEVRDIHLSGNVMYVGAGRGGLYVYDITNPSEPVELYRVVNPPLFSSLYLWTVVPLNQSDFRDLAVVSYDRNPDGAALYTLGTVCDPIEDDLVDISLIGSGCTINEENTNTCEGTFTWDSGDSADPNIYNQNNSNECSTVSSGTNAPCLLLHGENTIQLRDGTDVLESIIVSAECASGLSYDSDSGTCVSLDETDDEDLVDGSCRVYTSPLESAPTDLCEDGNPSMLVEDSEGFYTWSCEGESGGSTDSCEVMIMPSVSLKANPAFVRSGDSTEIVLTVDTPFALTCEIVNAGSDITIVHLAELDSSYEYQRSTDKFYSTQIVEAVCIFSEDDIDFDPIRVSERIEVIPIVTEQ